jgi:hypothetical protein
MTGSILGQVREKLSKQLLQGANVIVQGTQSGATTGADGFFRIDGLSEDVYSVAVSFIGFAPALLTDIRVVRGRRPQCRMSSCRKRLSLETRSW